MKDVLGFLGAIAGIGCLLVIVIGAGTVALLGGMYWITNQTGLQQTLNQIEQVRSDSARVDPQQAEDVIGQVTEWNQYIVSKQTANDLWWSGWYIPDEWDNVDLIEVPQ